MINRVLTLEQAARHINIEARELLHMAQRGEIPSRRRGDDFYFEHNAVDDWAQRNLLELPESRLRARYRDEVRERKLAVGEDGMIPMLFAPERIDMAVASRTKPGAIRDMVALAFGTGLLYDDAQFLQDVSEREEIASTAMSGGVAFLHARYPDPYRAAESFAVLGRTTRPIHFGAPDEEPTDLFFLLCCIDDTLHLHALSRLCLLCRQPGFLDELRAAESGAEAYRVLFESETNFLRSVL